MNHLVGFKWRPMTAWIMVIIGPDNKLAPDDTKLLHEPMWPKNQAL